MVRFAKYKLPIIIFCILAGLISLDLYVGHVQTKKLEEKSAQKKRNELLAYYLERTAVEEITYTGKGNFYKMRLRYENVRPDEEMWIMIHTIKVFIRGDALREFRQRHANEARRLQRGAIERSNHDDRDIRPVLKELSGTDAGIFSHEDWQSFLYFRGGGGEGRHYRKVRGCLPVSEHREEARSRQYPSEMSIAS
jgi:hypothetical protein